MQTCFVQLEKLINESSKVYRSTRLSFYIFATLVPSDDPTVFNYTRKRISFCTEVNLSHPRNLSAKGAMRKHLSQQSPYTIYLQIILQQNFVHVNLKLKNQF